MKSIVFLICSLLFAFVLADTRSSSTITVSIFAGSNQYWVGLAVQNGNVATASVSVKDAKSSSYVPMSSTDWGYWTLTSPTGNPFVFPLTVSITSVNGDSIFTSISSLTSAPVNTGSQYGSSSAASSSATKATSAPVKATSVPVKATTASVKATTAPAKATSAPAKAAVPAKATTAPSSASANAATGCSAPTKLIVPLYTYPDSGWTTVANGASLVPTLVIINPNSGPGTGPDANYNAGMAKLHAAGAEIVGYVHTSYGTRAMADVKADIAQYASEFPLLSGIFIDESASTDEYVSYYTEVYEYIMTFPGWKYDIINPGTVTTAGYMQASTQIVAFEDSASLFASSSNPSYASCAVKDHFAMIGYAASQSAMQTSISAAISKGYYGWVYVTDGASGGETYNVLTSYYSVQASYLASQNA